MNLRIFILGLALVVALAAQLVQVHVLPPHPVGAAPTYIVDEDCEGVGTPSNWTDTGSPDWDYTVVVLEGSESLRHQGGSTAPRSHYDAGSAYDEVWLRFKWRSNVDALINRMLSIRLQSGDAENAWLEVASGLVLKITHGSATASTVSGVSADTDYNVWVHYKKGTGSNGEMSVGFSTGTTEPTSGDNYASLTNGTSTNQTDRWQWRNNTAITTRSYYFDSMIVDDAAIGDF